VARRGERGEPAEQCRAVLSTLRIPVSFKFDRDRSPRALPCVDCWCFGVLGLCIGIEIDRTAALCMQKTAVICRNLCTFCLPLLVFQSRAIPHQTSSGRRYLRKSPLVTHFRKLS